MVVSSFLLHYPIGNLISDRMMNGGGSMTKRRIYRSEQEWLQIITEGRQSGLTDHAWCELHNISNSSFYNAATRLRKKACQIPEPEKTSYVLDFTSHQEVVKLILFQVLFYLILDVCLYCRRILSYCVHVISTAPEMTVSVLIL